MVFTRAQELSLVVLLLLSVLFAGCHRKSPESLVRTLKIETKPLEVKELHTSMVGPGDEQRMTLGEGPRELLWVVGYEARLLSQQGRQPVPDRFMCHVNMDLDKELYQDKLAPRLDAAYRLVTLSQGATRVSFPPGFGMPVPSDQLIWFRSQILNLNEEQLSSPVQFEIKLHYIRDADLEQPLKSLFLVRAPVVKAVDPEANHFGGVASEAACSVGVNANPDGYLEKDSQGQEFIPHWKIGPGREETKTLITERLSLPDDMRVHTIVSHVHPTAESLTLIDLTTLEQVYQSRIKSSPDRLEMTTVDIYSSAEGLLLKQDHEYGLISVYDNHTDRELDSMAVMYLYLHDPAYIPPSTSEMATPLPPSSKVVTREHKQVVWQCGTLYPLVTAFYGSLHDWKVVETTDDRSEWEGPPGRLLVEQTGSTSKLTLVLDQSLSLPE